MRLALYEPDIPQNTGTLLRLAACLSVPVDLIGPAGFDMTDRAMRRAALDYLAHVEIARHPSFAAFETARRGRRRFRGTSGIQEAGPSRFSSETAGTARAARVPRRIVPGYGMRDAHPAH